MAKRINTKTTLAEVAAMAEEDGYRNLSRATCSAIKRACLRGSCAWTADKIVTVDESRLTIFPGARYVAGNNTDYRPAVEFSHEDDAVAFYNRHLRPRLDAGNLYHAFARANFGDRSSIVEEVL